MNVATSEFPLTGGCLCGGVRYELDERPILVGYCHCTRCQRRTGTAAAISAQIAPGSLRIVAGEEHIRAWTPDDGGFPKCFCTLCGGALWAGHPTERDNVFLRLGTFDSDPGVRPQYHQFVAYAAPWEPIPDDGLPRYPERRPLS
jgi:hypothetical protein